jgi:Tfp pilus assembly pilus retraction ATPase PilT
MAGMYCFEDLLNLVIREGAQHLSLETGKSPMLQVHGTPRLLDDVPSLTNDNVAELLANVASSEQIDELRRCGDLHFVYRSGESGNFAVDASSGRDHYLVKIRPI